MRGGMVDCRVKRRARNRRKPDQPWARHGHRGWGGACCVGSSYIWLSTETARKAPEPWDGNVTQQKPQIIRSREPGCTADSFLSLCFRKCTKCWKRAGMQRDHRSKASSSIRPCSTYHRAQFSFELTNLSAIYTLKRQTLTIYDEQLDSTAVFELLKL